MKNNVKIIAQKGAFLWGSTLFDAYVRIVWSSE